MRFSDPLPHTVSAAAKTAEGEITEKSASKSDAFAERVRPKRADRIIPDELTRMASSHSGQRVDCTMSGSAVRARMPALVPAGNAVRAAAVWMLHTSTADNDGGLKNAPT